MRRRRPASHANKRLSPAFISLAQSWQSGTAANRAPRWAPRQCSTNVACCVLQSVHLSGAAIDAQEIEVLCEAFRAYSAESKRWIVLMLHSSLPAEDQDKV